MPLPAIHPPLIPTAGPWTTTFDDVFALYSSPYTGAVTTRTSLLNGFEHDPSKHQHQFFDARSSIPLEVRSPIANSTLNTLGYSSISLKDTLKIVAQVVTRAREAQGSNGATTSGRESPKPVIISVTGSPEEVVECYGVIRESVSQIGAPLCMEVNLSCPNIKDRPPPAFDQEFVEKYLSALKRAAAQGNAVPIGIKLPPYTYSTQFTVLQNALLAQDSSSFLTFITSTNTLGNCLILKPVDMVATRGGPQPSRFIPTVQNEAGTGIGGLAGAALHPLGLGNVQSLRNLLDQSEDPGMKNIQIIGAAGVQDMAGYQRMRSAGAAVVGIGSAVYKDGIEVFERIGAEASAALADRHGGSVNWEVESNLEALRV